MTRIVRGKIKKLSAFELQRMLDDDSSEFAREETPGELTEKEAKFLEEDLKIKERFSRLSQLITGAPDEVLPAKPGDIPEFSDNGLGKVYDLVGIMRDDVKLYEELRKSFNGKIVADLGAGELPHGLDAIHTFLPKAYVAVEPHSYRSVKHYVAENYPKKNGNCLFMSVVPI